MYLFDDMQLVGHDLVDVSQLFVGFSQFLHLLLQLLQVLTLVDELTARLQAATSVNE
jgi:hypothetical protein